MGLAYLTRYDAVACIAAAGLLVSVTTYRRARRRPRVRRAVLDMIVVSVPGVVSFLGWAAASWLITGEAFAQFTSQYGNSAILEQSGAVQVGLGNGLLFAATCVLLLAPVLVPLTIRAGFLRWRRPDWAMMVPPLAIFGSALAFQAVSYALGSTFPFLRFYIIAIPLTATIALLAVPDGTLVAPVRRGRHAPVPTAAPAPSTSRHRFGYAGVALAFALCVPIAAWGMSLPRYAPQEYALGAVINPAPESVSPRKATEHRIARTYSTERRIARYLDDLNLPNGAVITDTVYGFAIIAASRHPKTFAIPSDPDFVHLLNNPSVAGVEYLLVVPPAGRGVSDAINRRYPSLYNTGANIATLELEMPNGGEGQPNWRLYRVNEATSAQE
jgi:hypothetical protein